MKPRNSVTSESVSSADVSVAAGVVAPSLPAATANSDPTHALPLLPASVDCEAAANGAVSLLSFPGRMNATTSRTAASNLIQVSSDV